MKDNKRVVFLMKRGIVHVTNYALCIFNYELTLQIFSIEPLTINILNAIVVRHIIMNYEF